MAAGRRVRGGFLALVGYLLSPLSWWNDVCINIPLAYVFAVLVSLPYRPLFPYAMVAGYWFTNVLGLILLHVGGRQVLGRKEGARVQGVEGRTNDGVRMTTPPPSVIARPGRSDLDGGSGHDSAFSIPVHSSLDRALPRRLWIDVAIGTAYTAAIAALAFTGVLKPPAALIAKARGAPSQAESLIHFAREEIEMLVRPASVEITGTYHFRSETDKGVAGGIFYPFPLDSTLSYPDSVAIPGFRFERGDSGVMFRMSFPPRAETSFVAWYRQPLHAKSARYIVTTTRKWGRAIDRAEFTITVPRDFAGVELSYKPDRVDRTDSFVVYRFTRMKFYPDRDVIVTWR